MGGGARARAPPPSHLELPHLPQNSGNDSPPPLTWNCHTCHKTVETPPSTADNAGQRGQHHEHHWGPVSQIARLPVPPPTSIKWCSGPDGPRRLVFKTVRAHDAHFGGFNGPPKCFKNPSVPLGFASKTMSVLEWCWKGVRGGPLEKRRSNDAGSAALASAPWQSQGHGLRRQSKGVARF